MSTNKPELHAPYVAELSAGNIAGAIQILEDKGTHASIDCLNWADKFPYHPLTVVNVAHNGTHLFVDFFVRCNYLRAVNYQNNSPVSEDSCVELFISPTCNNTYFNFEINCIGTILASTRTKNEPSTKRRLNDEEIASIIRYASCGTKPFNEIEGLFAWNVVVAIPLALLGVEYNGTPLKMTANFNKCASGTSQPHYLTWSPIDNAERPDFHRPDAFGVLVLD